MSRSGRSGLQLLIGATALAAVVLGGLAYALARPPAPERRASAVVAAPSEAPMAASVGLERLRKSVATPSPDSSATASPPPAAPPKPEAASASEPAAFDASRAMAHVRELADGIGVRVGGTAGEWKAVGYARDYLASLGYQVAVMPVPLPNGRTSHDVIAKRRGASGPIVVLGGHIDTKAPAPGADDNATGVGTILELARDFASAPPRGDVRFVLFGTEELIGDGNSDHHHFGSRAYARSLTSAERSRFAAMISIDMIGFGPDFRVRTMGVGTRALSDRLLATAKRTGAPLAYLKDPGSSGWSDHEPFERAGFPSAWLEWRDNPNAHTSGDTSRRIDAGKVRTTGALVHAWLRSLTDADLAKLAKTR